MSHHDTAILFIERFCAADVAGLKPLLCKDLRFHGPLHQFDSRDEYLSVLSEDPPEPCSFRIESVTESEDSVAVFYKYQKSEGNIAIAQLFRFHDSRICEITLIFDARSFA